MKIFSFLQGWKQMQLKKSTELQACVNVEKLPLINKQPEDTSSIDNSIVIIDLISDEK